MATDLSVGHTETGFLDKVAFSILEQFDGKENDGKKANSSGTD